MVLTSLVSVIIQRPTMMSDGLGDGYPGRDMLDRYSLEDLMWT